MRIKSIKVNNFKVFKRPTEINFPLSNNDKNVYLIGGTNGAGKTTILEALNLCLYGGKKRQIFEWISKSEREKGNYELSIKVSLVINSGKELDIERIWKIDGIAINEPNAEDLEEKLIIKKDGEKRSVVDKKEWQEYINSIIPRGISEFFFFDAEKIEKLAEDKNSSSNLRSSIETILGLKSLRDLVEDLDSLRRKIKRDSVDVSDAQVKKFKSDLEYIEDEIRKLKEREKELMKEIEDKKKKRRKVEEEFQNKFNFSIEARKNLENLEQEKNKIEIKLDKIEGKMQEYSTEILPLALLQDKFSLIQKQIKKEEKIKQKKALQEEKNLFSKKAVEAIFKDDRCPVGAESVSEKDKEKLIKVVSKAITEKTGKEEIILGFSKNQIENLRLTMKEITRKSKMNFESLLKTKKNLENRLDEKIRDIEKLKMQEGEKEEFEELKQKLSNYENTIGRNNEELNQVNKDITEKKRDKTKKRKELDNLYEDHKKTKSAERLLKKIKLIQDVLNEYIKVLREKKLEDLKKNIFKMYEDLAYKSDQIKDIHIDSEDYTVRIVDKGGKYIKKKNLSAGEKEIYAISLLWGLSETSAYNLPIIIDTPLARLDETHRSRIVNKYLPNAGEQVIVLSTDTEINEEYYEALKPHIEKAYHLNFDKKRQWSTLEKNYFWK